MLNLISQNKSSHLILLDSNITHSYLSNQIKLVHLKHVFKLFHTFQNSIVKHLFRLKDTSLKYDNF